MCPGPGNAHNKCFLARVRASEAEQTYRRLAERTRSCTLSREPGLRVASANEPASLLPIRVGNVAYIVCLGPKVSCFSASKSPTQPSGAHTQLDRGPAHVVDLEAKDLAHILPGPRGGVCLVLWEGRTLPGAEVGRGRRSSRVTENMGS